jgi:hypothetical protein
MRAGGGADGGIRGAAEVPAGPVARNKLQQPGSSLKSLDTNASCGLFAYDNANLYKVSDRRNQGLPYRPIFKD